MSSILNRELIRKQAAMAQTDALQQVDAHLKGIEEALRQVPVSSRLAVILEAQFRCAEMFDRVR